MKTPIAFLSKRLAASVFVLMASLALVRAQDNVLITEFMAYAQRPRDHQPLPRCGFVIVGTEGSIASYDFQPSVHLQTRAEPAGARHAGGILQPPRQNPIQYVIHCLETGEAIQGPLSPEIPAPVSGLSTRRD